MSENQNSQSILQPGQPAPDFTLPTTPDQSLSLSDFRGRPVVLVFYPADFSPVCGDQMVLYNELTDEFKRHNAVILGISCDNVWSHLEFVRQKNLKIPLLSDFEPKGEVSRMYGAYRTEKGSSARALFVIDPQGVICWSYLSPSGINPGADGILQALEEMNGQNESGGAHG